MSADGADIPEWGCKIHQERRINSLEVNQHTLLHAAALHCYYLSANTHLIHLKLAEICLLSLQPAFRECSSGLPLEEVQMIQELTWPWAWWSNQWCSQCNSDGRLLRLEPHKQQLSFMEKKEAEEALGHFIGARLKLQIPTYSETKQNKTIISIIWFPNCNGIDLTLMPRLVVLNRPQLVFQVSYYLSLISGLNYTILNNCIPFTWSVLCHHGL